MSSSSGVEASLRSWFASKLTEQGLGGLESVYDYVITLETAAEVYSYLESLLGSSAVTRSFAAEYLERRKASAFSGKEKAIENADIAAGDPTRGYSGQRSRGGNREKRRLSKVQSGWRGMEVSAEGIKRVVGRAEKGQRKMREWMQEGGKDRLINCLRCGRIHRTHEVQKDGACLFCGRDLFEDWEDGESPVAAEMGKAPLNSGVAEQALDHHAHDDVGAEIDPWLSPAERREAKARRNQAADEQRDRTFKVDIDIQAHQITQTKMHPKQSIRSSTGPNDGSNQNASDGTGDFINPHFAGRPPTYIPSGRVDWVKLTEEAESKMKDIQKAG